MLGPGDTIASRYELVRMLGGGDAGRVYVAYDRHLAREVALRFVEPGDPTAAETLLDEGRRMARVQFDCRQAIAVLDAGEIPGGGAYVATEIIAGSLSRRSPCAGHRCPSRRPAATPSSCSTPAWRCATTRRIAPR